MITKVITRPSFPPLSGSFFQHFNSTNPAARFATESQSSAKYKAWEDLVAHWQSVMTSQERDSLQPACVKKQPPKTFSMPVLLLSWLLNTSSSMSHSSASFTLPG